ncbi:MAG: hypothetical protein U5L96_00665 [Owenweeksia sp.]|nr:hypothetical protein [Owenweeksia sp.]
MNGTRSLSKKMDESSLLEGVTEFLRKSAQLNLKLALASSSKNAAHILRTQPNLNPTSKW